MQLIDLSHSIENGLITYKGLPAPVICDFFSRQESSAFYESGTSFQIGRIDMVSNTGTYVDCPFHRYENGTDLNETAIDRFIAKDAEVFHFNYETAGLAIDAEVFASRDIAGKAILVHTGWSKHWNTQAYFENHPFLTEAAAQFLTDHQVKLVGIDSHNIDDTRTGTRPVHSILLANEILIVEHLTNLSLLPDSGFEFHAVPPKIKGMGTFPVRAYGKIG